MPLSYLEVKRSHLEAGSPKTHKVHRNAHETNFTLRTRLCRQFVSYCELEGVYRSSAHLLLQEIRYPK